MRELQKDVEKELLVSIRLHITMYGNTKSYQLLPESERDAMRTKFGVFVGM